jgi:hypothetical protein
VITKSSDENLKEDHVKRVLSVLNIRKIHCDFVRDLLKKCSSKWLGLLINKGLNPRYVFHGISVMENFDPELLKHTISCARTHKSLETKYFSPNAISKIIDKKKEDNDHTLETLKILDEHGCSLNIGTDSGFTYYGKNMKEIIMLLVKHGSDKNHLLYWTCSGCCDAEAIKYLVKECGTKWDDNAGEGTLLELVSKEEECSPELLRFLIEDLKLSTAIQHDEEDDDPRPPPTPFDNILQKARNLKCIEYMLSIDAPFTIDMGELPFEKRMMLTVCGKAKPSKFGEGEYTLAWFEKFWIKYLNDIIMDICDSKKLGREVYEPDQEPVWDPDRIDFRKVPLNYFLDAVYLFCHGSYHESHPYYQKVIDLYGKKEGFHRSFTTNIMEAIKKSLKVISTLLHWSPIERHMLGDEAERDLKRIKTNK